LRLRRLGHLQHWYRRHELSCKLVLRPRPGRAADG
jgi:hypothetical protein